MNIGKQIDAGSLLVMAITFILFLTALFTTGLTHDLLLEAGVFLVSVKLMLIGHKNTISTGSIRKQLDEIHLAVQQLGPSHAPKRGAADRPAQRDLPSADAPDRPGG